MRTKSKSFLLASCLCLLLSVGCSPIPRNISADAEGKIVESKIALQVESLARKLERASVRTRYVPTRARTHYELALDYVRRAKALVREAPHPIWDRAYMIDELDEIEFQIRVLARRGVLDKFRREAVGEDPDRLIVTEILTTSGISRKEKESGDEGYSPLLAKYEGMPVEERLVVLGEEIIARERNTLNLKHIKGTSSVLMETYLSETLRNLQKIVRDRKATQEVDYRLYQRIEKLIAYVRAIEQKFGAEVVETSSLPRYNTVVELQKLNTELDSVNAALGALKSRKKEAKRKGKENHNKYNEHDELIERARSWR